MDYLAKHNRVLIYTKLEVSSIDLLNDLLICMKICMASSRSINKNLKISANIQPS